MIWSLIRCPCWNTMPSFLITERNPMMTPLEEKLNQLSLSTMSHHLETTLTEAAAKDLGAAATLERLADMALKAGKHGAIDRRVKSSRLTAQPTVHTFNFH